MENANETINIRQKLEEKMQKRGISTEYLSEELVEKTIASINDDVEKKIDSIIELISQEYEAKKKEDEKTRQDLLKKEEKIKSISREDKKPILDLLIQGKTIEEIRSIEKYKKYSTAQLAKFQNKKMNKVRILAVQLVPIEEIAIILDLRKESIYAYFSDYVLNGKTIMQIRRAKEQEIVKRVEAGQSAEEILSDRELNICKSAVDDVIKNEREKSERKELSKIRRNERQQKKRLSERENKSQIIQMLYAGKTIEEIAEQVQFNVEDIRKIQEENMEQILALQLMPVSEIAEKLGINKANIYYKIRKTTVNGKTIKQIRKDKIQEITRRLEAGQSIEEIVDDRELNVCAKFINLRELNSIKKAQDAELNVCREALEKEQSNLRNGVQSIGKTKEALNFKSTSITKETTVSEEGSSKTKNPNRKIESERRENTQKNINKKSDVKKDQNTETISKLDIMRKKYKAKYSNEPKKSSKKQTLTPEENEKINKALVEMLEAVNLCDGKKASSRTLIKSILNNAGLVYGKSVSLSQVSQLMSIVESGKIDVSLKYFSREVAEKINKIRKSVHGTLADAVEAEVDDVSDMSELESLSKMLNTDMEKGNYHVQNAKSKVQRRIDKIRLEQRMKSLREDIPDDIKSIIEGIAKGEVDIEAAKSIIAEKAAEKVRGKKATRFTLTEEQERRQYLVIIRKALNEQGSKYPIENPEKTIELLEQLTDDTSLTNLNTVIANQTSRKKFDEAQDLCQKYISKLKDNMEDRVYLNSIRKRIRNEKIGDLVYRTIHTDISAEDEKKFWDLLQQGLSMGNVKMSNINIGRTQDGLRNITLQDIWPDEEKEIKK